MRISISWFLSRRRVRLYEDHLELTPPSFKTDPFRRGFTLTVAATNNEACPVPALKPMSQRCAASLSSPLFEIHAYVPGTYSPNPASGTKINQPSGPLFRSFLPLRGSYLHENSRPKRERDQATSKMEVRLIPLVYRDTPAYILASP